MNYILNAAKKAATKLQYFFCDVWSFCGLFCGALPLTLNYHNLCYDQVKENHLALLKIYSAHVVLGVQTVFGLFLFFYFRFVLVCDYLYHLYYILICCQRHRHKYICFRIFSQLFSRSPNRFISILFMVNATNERKIYFLLLFKESNKKLMMRDTH